MAIFCKAVLGNRLPGFERMIRTGCASCFRSRSTVSRSTPHLGGQRGRVGTGLRSRAVCGRGSARHTCRYGRTRVATGTTSYPANWHTRSGRDPAPRVPHPRSPAPCGWAEDGVGGPVRLHRCAGVSGRRKAGPRGGGRRWRDSPPRTETEVRRGWGAPCQAHGCPTRPARRFRRRAPLARHESGTGGGAAVSLHLAATLSLDATPVL